MVEHPRLGGVRILDVNGNPWLCAADVCRILGHTNSRKAVDDHCRKWGVTIGYTGVQTGVKRSGDAAMQQVPLTFISEGNVYRLIARSRLPAAEKFEAWIFDEVLPSIRRTGSYHANARVRFERRDWVRYDLWLGEHGFSVLSSCVGSRKRRYPDDFRLIGDRWYISEALGVHLACANGKDFANGFLPEKNKKS